MVFHAVLGGERPPDQCNQCCSAVGYGQRIGQWCFSPWVGGLLSGLFFIPSGWRVSYFTASGTLSVGIIWIVLYVCVVLLPSGRCCLPVSLLDSRCLAFTQFLLSRAWGRPEKKGRQKCAADSIQLIRPVLDGLFPICSSDVDSDDIVE